MTRLARAYKLMVSLKAQGLATREVEGLVAKRRNQRSIILGKMDRICREQQECKYREMMMETCVYEARRDWHEARKEFRRERLRLINLARNEQERNLVKHGLKSIDIENDRVYKEIGIKHDRKIEHLKSVKEQETTEPQKGPKAWDNKLKAWVALVAAGDGREKEEQQQHRVHVYG